VNASREPDGIAAKRARLAELEALLAALRTQYEQLMNAFRFEVARALHTRIEATERERNGLARELPPAPREPPPMPFAVARRHRR